MTTNDIFTFGKFKGLRLIDVFQGTPNIDRQLLRDYVDFMLKSDDRWNYDDMFGSSSFQLIDEFEIREKEIKVTGLQIEPWDENSEKRFKPGNIEKLLDSYLSLGNQVTGRMIGGFHSLEDINKLQEPKSIIGASPDYICWCIKEVDGFYIDPPDIEQLEKLKITIFKGVNVIFKADDTYEYSPKTETKNFSFSEVVKEKNQTKMEEANSHDNEPEYHHDSYDDIVDSSYCGACQESPCMCSDPERTSTVYDY